MALISTGTTADQLQSGTTQQRPSGLGTSDQGLNRFNTDGNALEQWTGTAWTVALDIQNGSFEKNIITWRNEGEIASWSTTDSGPGSGGGGPRGVYSNRPVSGGTGSGATVSLEYSNANLSTFTVNNPGIGYSTGDIITVDLDGTNTVSGPITVANENVEEGWEAKAGTEYFVSGRVDANYNATPQFNYGIRVGNGNNNDVSGGGADFDEIVIQDSTLLLKPVGLKNSMVSSIACASGAKERIYNKGNRNDQFMIECYTQELGVTPTLTTARVELSMGALNGTDVNTNDGQGTFYVKTRDTTNTGTNNIQVSSGKLTFKASQGNDGTQGSEFIITNDGVGGALINNNTTTSTANVALSNSAGGFALQKSTSSRRYKNNIRDVELSTAQALDVVSQLQPRLWEDYQSGETVVGFIAEEVFELTGEEFVVFAPWTELQEVTEDGEEGSQTTRLVRTSPLTGNGQAPVTRDGGDLTDDSEVVDSINDRGLIAALVGAVQELKTINADLVARLDAAGI